LDLSGFRIEESSGDVPPAILLTPDIACCDRCRGELGDRGNRRYRYAFTTCLECGPRYSIMKALPYDRENTTMAEIAMCGTCGKEYNDIQHPRHYSQTNSCKDCSIPMHLHDSHGGVISNDSEEILAVVNRVLGEGAIVAVKGIGGYLLLCDATDPVAIRLLRVRKRRPQKPFALLYGNLEMAEADIWLRPVEIAALRSRVAPIVLCPFRERAGSGICKELIAPGLDKAGLMLPYTPLLVLIAEGFGKPLVATSGNISGSPILYKDEDAIDHLSGVADYLLAYERDIVMPQDDSVMAFTEAGLRILMRRSRGLAPGYFPLPFPDAGQGTMLAMGGEMKSAFALLNRGILYISQYLGDQGDLDAQCCYQESLMHLLQMLKVVPQRILVDQHPGYFVSDAGKELAGRYGAALTSVQHHTAHFAAVLAENVMLEEEGPVLGIIWDGAGYGEDGQVWGGEVLCLADGEIGRVAHLDYFPQLLGDKMNREPRLSALSLLQSLPQRDYLMEDRFSPGEWNYYRKLQQQPARLLTSSMGRLLDGIAAILGIAGFNTYEGEAVMRMEAIARTCTEQPEGYYDLPLVRDRLDWRQMLAELLEDVERGVAVKVIAWKLFDSLAWSIVRISDHFGIDRVAVSGGVFQNVLLVERIQYHAAAGKKQIYFHRQLSPNDECIGFGQLAYFNLPRNVMAGDHRHKTTSLCV